MLQIDKFPRWTLDDYTLKRYPDLNVPAGQYGVPLVMFVWQFWHSTDLYNEAGVSVPKRGWTWDDFVTAARPA
jgi:ABC-type glycerol-3-phosphate transport system substrate-binding protein